jgi:hypothetical protein
MPQLRDPPGRSTARAGHHPPWRTSVPRSTRATNAGPQDDGGPHRPVRLRLHPGHKVTQPRNDVAASGRCPAFRLDPAIRVLLAPNLRFLLAGQARKPLARSVPFRVPGAASPATVARAAAGTADSGAAGPPAAARNTWFGGEPTTHDPAGATHDPAGATHDPAGATHDPAGATHDPAGATHDGQLLLFGWNARPRTPGGPVHAAGRVSRARKRNTRSRGVWPVRDENGPGQYGSGQ